MNTLVPQLAQQTAHLYGFEGTTAEAIFIGCFSCLVLVAAIVAKLNLRLWLIAGMLFATALTPPIDQTMTTYIQTWMTPAQLARAKIHVAFGIALTLLSFGQGLSVRQISSQGVFMLVVQFYLAIMQTVHADLETSVQTLGFALLVIPCMILCTPRLCSDFNGCVSMLRTVMWVSVLWTFCCSVQFVIDPQKLVNSAGRFWGMLGNAQQVALLCAPFVTFALWLLLHDPNRRTKPLWIALIGINLLFLFWSGSRTGVLMTVIGFGGVLYSRIGKAILLLPVAVGMTYVLFLLSEALQIGGNLERFTSGEDTRTGVWAVQWATAMENPLIGSGAEGNFSENSYLAGFANFGIGMFLILVAYLLVSMFLCIKLFIGRRLLPPGEKALVDVVLAFNAMYFIGGFFEGFMYGRSASMQAMMLMIAGIAVFLRERIRGIEAGESLAFDEDHPHDDYGVDDGTHDDHPHDVEHRPASGQEITPHPAA